MRQFKATRWNTPDEKGVPAWTRDNADHPAVRPTHYMEIADLYGTSGCSKGYPYWTYVAMGIIDTNRGKVVVEPGDWIIEPMEGVYLVVTDTHYRQLCGEPEEATHAQVQPHSVLQSQ
jgi:hypothetical protein